MSCVLPSTALAGVAQPPAEVDAPGLMVLRLAEAPTPVGSDLDPIGIAGSSQASDGVSRPTAYSPPSQGGPGGRAGPRCMDSRFLLAYLVYEQCISLLYSVCYQYV